MFGKNSLFVSDDFLFINPGWCLFLIGQLFQRKCHFAIIISWFFFCVFLFLLQSWHSAKLVLWYHTLGNQISTLCLWAIFVQLKLQSVTAAALCCRCAAVDLKLRGRRDPEHNVWMSGDLCTQMLSQWHFNRYGEGDETDRCGDALPVRSATWKRSCEFIKHNNKRLRKGR